MKGFCAACLFLANVNGLAQTVSAAGAKSVAYRYCRDAELEWAQLPEEQCTVFQMAQVEPCNLAPCVEGQPPNVWRVIFAGSNLLYAFNETGQVAAAFLELPWESSAGNVEPDSQHRVANANLLAKIEGAYHRAGWAGRLKVTRVKPRPTGLVMDVLAVPMFGNIPMTSEEWISFEVNHDTCEVCGFSSVRAPIEPPATIEPRLTLLQARDVICKFLSRHRGVQRFEEYLEPIQLAIWRVQDWKDGVSTLDSDDLQCMSENRGKLVYYGRLHDGDYSRDKTSGIPMRSHLVVIDASDGHLLRFDDTLDPLKVRDPKPLF